VHITTHSTSYIAMCCTRRCLIISMKCHMLQRSAVGAEATTCYVSTNVTNSLSTTRLCPLQADLDQQALAGAGPATASAASSKKGKAAVEAAAAEAAAAKSRSARPSTAAQSAVKKPAPAGQQPGGTKKGKAKKKAADPVVTLHFTCNTSCTVLCKPCAYLSN
jgi:hypothetical protein